MPGLWNDMTLRPYLGRVRDSVSTFTSPSCLGTGQRLLDTDYLMPGLSTKEDGHVGSVMAALARYSVLAVTTDYSGASLLCRYVAKEFASGKVDHLPIGLHDFLPVYIDLPGLERELFASGTSLRDVITHLYGDIVDWEQSSFLTRLTLGSALVVLDNLDHLTPEEHAVALAWVQEAQSWNSVMLVPTRHPKQPGLDHLTVLRAEGLSLAHVDLIAKRRLTDFKRIESFALQLSLSDSLRRLVQHPEALWVLLDLQHIDGRMPTSEMELFPAFVEAAARTIKTATPAKTGIPLYLQKNWLLLAGFRLHERAVSGGAAYASRKELEGYIQEVLGEESSRMATQNLSITLTKTALFVKVRDGIGFVSKSLQAALASQYVARHVVSPSFILGRTNNSGVSRVLIEQWSKDPQWNEVMEGVKSIIKKEQDPAWMSELNDAMGQPA
jgi:hypothetical protein